VVVENPKIPGVPVSGIGAELERAIREVGGGDEDILVANNPERSENVITLIEQLARAVVPLERQVFVVTIDGGQGMEQMREATSCWSFDTDWNKVVYKPRFAGTGQIVQRRLRLVQFVKIIPPGQDNTIFVREALPRMINNKGIAATYEDGLAFSAQFPKMQVLHKSEGITVLDPEGPVVKGQRRVLVMSEVHYSNQSGYYPIKKDVRTLELETLDERRYGYMLALALCDE